MNIYTPRRFELHCVLDSDGCPYKVTSHVPWWEERNIKLIAGWVSKRAITKLARVHLLHSNAVEQWYEHIHKLHVLCTCGNLYASDSVFKHISQKRRNGQNHPPYSSAKMYVPRRMWRRLS